MMNQYTFDNVSIDKASQDVSDFMQKYKVDSKSNLCFRLTLEEILLKYAKRFGEQAVFELKCVKRFQRLRIELSVVGEAVDPFENDAESGNILPGLVSTMGAYPIWQHRNGKNIIVFMPQKEPFSQTVKLILGIAAALVLGGICQLLPAETRLAISSNFVAPITDTFMGLLTAVSGPLIFLTVLGAITEMGNMETLGKIGKKLLSFFFVVSILMGVLHLFLMLPFFGLRFGNGGRFELSGLLGLLLDLIPDNLFTPFTEGNLIQIIIVAVMGGVAILMLGSKVSHISTLLTQLTYMINIIAEGITSLLHFLVFGVILDMILGDSFAVVLQFYRSILVIMLVTALLFPILLVFTVLRRKISALLLIKKVMPVFLICLTTASSSAAFATNVEVCTKRLGIDRKLVNFGLPMGTMIISPGHVAMYIGISLSLAQSYGIATSPFWLILAFIGSFVLASATPSVVGGTLVALSVLFTQLGIPGEAIAVAAAVSILLDFFATAINMFCVENLLIEVSAQMNLLDEETLKSDIM